MASEQDAYRQISQEVDSGSMNTDAWARALQASNGDAKKAAAHYVQIRLAQLGTHVPTEDDDEDEEPYPERVFAVPATLRSERLTVSARTIKFAAREIVCSEVIGIRGGVLTHSVNGIQTKTNYQVVVGTAKQVITVEFSDPFFGSSRREIFGEIYDSIIHVAGIPLLNRSLRNLSAGKTVTFGGIPFSKQGAMLTRHKFLFSGDREWVPWPDLSLGSANGAIVVQSTRDKKLHDEASLRDTWNSCLVGPLIRHLCSNNRYATL